MGAFRTLGELVGALDENGVEFPRHVVAARREELRSLTMLVQLNAPAVKFVSCSHWSPLGVAERRTGVAGSMKGSMAGEE